MDSNKQMYVLANNSYYSINDCKNIIVPQNVDYKTSTSQVTMNTGLQSCNISTYMYHSDLITDCNAERVCFMKDYILNEEVTAINNLNDDYIIAISYSLYNKDGEIISSNTTSMKAKYCKAVIMSGINEVNALEYRNAFVFDSYIEVQVPRVSRYGIKSAFTQHPYTFKIDKIAVYTTIGDYKYVRESDSQVDLYDPHHHASNVHYAFHHHPHMSCNNFASNFLTNAKVGTTLIDHMVGPAELQIPPEYTEVLLCEIDCSMLPHSTTVIDYKLDLITINVEVLLDNFNTVYNSEDIQAIIEYNNADTPEIPDDDIDDPVVDTPTDDKPTDTTEPDDGSDDTTSDTTDPTT